LKLLGLVILIWSIY